MCSLFAESSFGHQINLPGTVAGQLFGQKKLPKLLKCMPHFARETHYDKQHRFLRSIFCNWKNIEHKFPFLNIFPRNSRDNAYPEGKIGTFVPQNINMVFSKPNLFFSMRLSDLDGPEQVKQET